MFIISVKLEFLVLIELIFRYQFTKFFMSILYEPLYEYYIIYFLIFARIMIIICPT